MTTHLALTIDQALRRAAVRATLAPSMGNLQPWRLKVDDHSLEVHVDWTHRNVHDPTGRQSVISCGCALFNARVSLAADHLNAVVDRYPDPDRPDCLARLTIPDDPDDPALGGTASSGSGREIGRLDDVIESRRTSRQPFDDEPVTPEVVARLIFAAANEGGRLLEVSMTQDREMIQKLAQVEAPCVLVLTTAADGPAAWLWAGEALEHVLLEVTRQGYTSRPLTEFLEPADARAAVSSQLGISTYPQVVVVVGHAAPTPGSRRRRLVEVLSSRG